MSNWELLQGLLGQYGGILDDLIVEMEDNAGNPTKLAFLAGRVRQVTEVVGTLEYWLTRIDEEEEF